MGSLPIYPGPTKELSVNYTAGGEPFAIANDVEDDLDPRDIWRIARSLEDHQHGVDRGLPVNRIGTSTTPQAAGDIGVVGDDFTWWGQDQGAPLTAVNAELPQSINGIKRLNDPMMLPQQGSAPPAPGPGLAYLYLGPGERLYMRSGNNAPAPVGTPNLLGGALSWNTQQQAGETLLQQLGLATPTYVQTFRPAGNDSCKLHTFAPWGYGGTPITFVVDWTCTVGAGKVNFTMLCRVTTAGGDLTVAPVSVASTAVDAPGTAWLHNQAVFTWTTGLPQAGASLQFVLRRDDTAEAAAGTKFPSNVSMLQVGVVYG